MLILEIIGGLILLVLLAAAFSPTNWSIKTDIVIDKTAQEVYNYVKMLRNSEQYNKWVMTDPTMKKEFRGTDGTVGSVYCWDCANKSVGKGEQEIMQLKEGERVDYEIRFIKPFPGISPASIIMESISANQTKVTWTFSSSNTYFLKIMHVLMNLKKILTKDLQTSLTNLKTILEK